MRIENLRAPDYIDDEGTECFVMTVRDEEIAITNTLNAYGISLEILQAMAQQGKFPSEMLRSTWNAWVWINDPARNTE